MTVRTWFSKKGGLLLAIYRLGYVIFSFVTLIPVLSYMQLQPQQALFTYHGLWHIPQLLLLGYAGFMFYSGTKVYDTGYFLGLSQWMDYRVGKQTAPLPFRDTGILSHVRHPWYSGGLALLWGIGPITDLTLASKIVLTLYLIIGTLLEEKKLKRELGSQYNRYCQEVPMLIPWKIMVQ